MDPMPAVASSEPSKPPQAPQPIDPSRSEAAKTRVSAACAPCSARKTKCDGGKPICERKRPRESEVDQLRESSLDPLLPHHAASNESSLVMVPKILGQVLPAPNSVAAATTPAEPKLAIPPKSTIHRGPVHQAPPLTRTPLPEDLIRQLLRQYWQFVHPYWPILYKPSIEDPASIGIYRCLPALVVNCMLSAAIGTLRTVSVEVGALTHAFLWKVESEMLLEAVGHPSPGGCAALVLMTIRLQRDGERTKAWQYLGLACRMVQDLALHRDSPRDSRAEEYRRIYWATFVLDKLLAVEPYMLRAKTADVRYPSEFESDEYEVAPALGPGTAFPSKSRSLSCFNALCRLSLAFESILDLRLNTSPSDLSKPFLSLIHTLLERWAQDLPAHLHHHAGPGPHVPLNAVAIHLLHQSAVALLHTDVAADARAKLAASGKPDISENSLSTTACKQAAERYCELLFQYSESVNIITTVLPFMFPSLLVGCINDALGTPKALEHNRQMLEVFKKASATATFVPVPGDATMRSLLSRPPPSPKSYQGHPQDGASSSETQAHSLTSTGSFDWSQSFLTRTATALGRPNPFELFYTNQN